MQKKSLLALLLALMMLLSGCALVATDTEKDNARVIVDVNGQTVNKATIHAAVENQLSQNEYYNQLYAAYGITGTLSTDETQVTAEVIQTYVERLVLEQKAAELGLNQLTEEELADVQKKAEEDYDTFIQSVASTYMPGSKLEGDELKEAAARYAAEHSITTADGRSTLADFIETETLNKAVEKVQEDIVKDVAVTEEEIQNEFNARVESAKTAYADNPDQYGTQRNSSQVIYYAPAGYRVIKHILVPFAPEATNDAPADTAYADAASALETAQSNLDSAAEDADKAALQAAVDEAQKALDEVKAAVKAKADEVYALATAEGADFDALVAEYSTDSMPAAGYVVREGYAPFVAEFVAGAMALTNPGDVSEPVETTYGYHIIQYVSDVEEGPVDIETVRDSLTNALTEQKKTDTTEATLLQWVSEAKVSTYPDRVH